MLPPQTYALHRKFCCFFACSQIYKAGIVVQRIYSVRCDFPQFWKREIIDPALSAVFYRPVLPACVLEISYVSFFLQSTEMTGIPPSRNIFACLLMNSNCVFRSGCCFPSCMVFWFSCLLYPNSSISLETVSSLTSIPYSDERMAAALYVLTDVWNRTRVGSPYVFPSRMRWRASATPGVFPFHFFVRLRNAGNVLLEPGKMYPLLIHGHPSQLSFWKARLLLRL